MLVCWCYHKHHLPLSDMYFSWRINVHDIPVFLCKGNWGSAFIQVDVGRSSWSLDHPYVTLLPTATLMSPADSKQGIGRQNVRMFKKGIKHANPSPLLLTQPSVIPHLVVAFVILCSQDRFF